MSYHHQDERNRNESMTPYQDLSSLVIHLTKDVDYGFNIMDRSDHVSIVTIHGGTIEPLCSLLAASIAADTHNLYDMQGLVAFPESIELRIPPLRYKEMRLRGLLQHSQVAVGIDGIAGTEPFVNVGGRNRRLRAILLEHLESAGYSLNTPVSTVAGHHPKLYHNWPVQGGVGVQMSRGLREQMVDGDLDHLWETETHGAATVTDCYRVFVQTVRDALSEYTAEMLVDLDRTMNRFERDTAAFPPSLRSSRPYHHE